MEDTILPLSKIIIELIEEYFEIHNSMTVENWSNILLEAEERFKKA